MNESTIASVIESIIESMNSTQHSYQKNGWTVLITRGFDTAAILERCEWCTETFGDARTLFNPSGTWRACVSKDRGFHDSAYEFQFQEDAWNMFKLRWL